MRKQNRLWASFEFKMIMLILSVTLSLSLGFYLTIYNQYWKLTIDSLKNDAEVVYQYVDEILDESGFSELNTIEDEVKDVYITTHKQLEQIRRIANVRYLYTAKRTAEGEYIYVVDGLDRNAEDFYHVGTPIEHEIVTDLSKCLNDESVLDEEIKVTEWGIVYVTYFPVHANDGSIVGAIGLEFDCENLYNSFTRVRMITILISVSIAALFAFIAVMILKKVVGNTEAVIRKKDDELIAAREEAIESSRAKSDFLSRMSHEIRTPMNAIIGMTKIAESTSEVSKLKYCIDTIGASSSQLLGLINDVLDMSKIEAGKFELEHISFNVEKVLMRVCNLIVDKTEQKSQKLDVNIAAGMRMHFVGDELRLSQIITNLLSNAVKFTPENGSITLSVSEKIVGDSGVLRFEVADTGIGMTKEQVDKLFTSYGQADQTISRRFGGTGLGLAISKNIVEKMDGKIWVESAPGQGSNFIFEIKLERASQQDKAVIFSGITPSDLHTLVVDGDEVVRGHVISVVDSFGIKVDEADSGGKAIELVKSRRENRKAYDVIFLDYNLPDMDGIEAARALNGLIDKNTVVIMTSFLEWNKIETEAGNVGISRYIAKPLFPSTILDTINEIVGSTLKNLEIEAEQENDGGTADFSDVRILLVEDVDINREIFAALLEDTGLQIDEAENGRIAVEKFTASPKEYDLIIMDIQMPEMDGYQAAEAIRAMDIPEAREIPIIAMTANAFKEDVEKCKAAGMNDHLAKPIDTDAVIEKIMFYSGKTSHSHV